MRLETRYPPPIYDEETLTLDWNGYQFFLGNIYEDYSRLATKEAAKSLETTFKRIKSLVEREGTQFPFEKEISSLLPVIRSRSYVENLLQDEKIPYRLVNEYIAVVISIDTESSIVILKENWFEENDLDFDKAFNYAIQNLEAINEAEFEEIFDGVWRSPWKDGYDPSRILCGIDTTKNLNIKGDPVILIHHREVLIITGSEDIKGMDKAIEFCEEYHDLNRSITRIPFTMLERDDGNYSLDVFTLPEEHPLYKKISFLIQRSG